jgi:hypothetical protein
LKNYNLRSLINLYFFVSTLLFSQNGKIVSTFYSSLLESTKIPCHIPSLKHRPSNILFVLLRTYFITYFCLLSQSVSKHFLKTLQTFIRERTECRVTAYTGEGGAEKANRGQGLTIAEAIINTSEWKQRKEACL